ncbi:MAG: rubredoxin [Spirochaetaceae bacterium]|nr:MAG: rubredoxin [Spirochaetaceae bacterium]
MPDTTGLSAVFSNLSKAADKQQLFDTAERFSKLSTLFPGAGPGEPTIESLRAEVARDVERDYPALQAAGTEASDRGVLRAVKWGEKVTTAQRALIDRYTAKGDQLLDEKKLFVCEACGFIFLGDEPPEICPVCKAPSARFSTVK